MNSFEIKSNADPDILAFISGWNRSFELERSLKFTDIKGKAEGYKRGLQAGLHYIHTGELPKGVKKL